MDRRPSQAAGSFRCRRARAVEPCADIQRFEFGQSQVFGGAGAVALRPQAAVVKQNHAAIARESYVGFDLPGAVGGRQPECCTRILGSGR